jgi:hypothetical protein
MPVVHVRALPPAAGGVEFALAGIAEGVAAAVPCDVSHIWCTFSAIGVETLGTTVVGEHGAIVYLTLQMRAREDGASAGRALEAACRAAARGFAVPVEDVWGTFEPVEPGRTFAGGGLIEP